MTGQWTETYHTFAHDQFVKALIEFRTGGQKWDSGPVVQNYLMIEDLAAPGHYTTIVANCDYIRWNSYEPPKAIKVYYGENSWSDSGRWDQINA